MRITYVLKLSDFHTSVCGISVCVSGVWFLWLCDKKMNHLDSGQLNQYFYYSIWSIYAFFGFILELHLKLPHEYLEESTFTEKILNLERKTQGKNRNWKR